MSSDPFDEVTINSASAIRLSQDPLELLSMPRVAKILDLHPRSLENWRAARKGPPYVTVGGRIRYRSTDLIAWLEVNTRKHDERRSSTGSPSPKRREKAGYAARFKPVCVGGGNASSVKRRIESDSLVSTIGASNWYTRRCAYRAAYTRKPLPV